GGGSSAWHGRTGATFRCQGKNRAKRMRFGWHVRRGVWYTALMTLPRTLLILALAVVPASGAPVPAVGPGSSLTDGLAGPEGLAFLKDGSLAVGSPTGRISRIRPDGSATMLAETGDSLAGLTTLHDGRLLAAAFGASRIWAVDPATRFTSVY